MEKKMDHSEDYSVLGSMLGYPDFRRLPNILLFSVISILALGVFTMRGLRVFKSWL